MSNSKSFILCFSFSSDLAISASKFSFCCLIAAWTISSTPFSSTWPSSSISSLVCTSLILSLCSSWFCCHYSVIYLRCSSCSGSTCLADPNSANWSCIVFLCWSISDLCWCNCCSEYLDCSLIWPCSYSTMVLRCFFCLSIFSCIASFKSSFCPRSWIDRLSLSILMSI